MEEKKLPKKGILKRYSEFKNKKYILSKIFVFWNQSFKIGFKARKGTGQREIEKINLERQSWEIKNCIVDYCLKDLTFLLPFNLFQGYGTDLWRGI